MKGLSPRNETEREFIKIFGDLCYGRSRFQVWDDFVHMAALSIVNAVDKKHFDEREDRYKRIVKPYKPKEMEGFVKLFSMTVLALESNPWQDFLGDLYMRCDLGNDHAGQFFTPYHICEFMAQCIIGNEEPIKDHIERHGYISLCDPCIGGGAMMIGAAQALHSQGINYQQCAVFAGQDIDPTVAMMAYIQLSLIGFPGYIHVGNSLTDPMTGHALFGDGKETTYYTPFFFSERMETLRKVAIMRNLLQSVGGMEKQQAVPSGDTGPPTIEISKDEGKAASGKFIFFFDS